VTSSCVNAEAKAERIETGRLKEPFQNNLLK
jgi:hypothetical protein